MTITLDVQKNLPPGLPGPRRDLMPNPKAPSQPGFQEMRSSLRTLAGGSAMPRSSLWAEGRTEKDPASPLPFIQNLQELKDAFQWRGLNAGLRELTTSH